ncbi:unnamed protein product, partial [Rotaria sp. Silwood2]
MIGDAEQADIAILVISARKGEFETGFECGDQTREHAMLVKTAGVRYLVVLINKMDDPTVNWDQTRYEEIRDKLTPYLKKCRFKHVYLHLIEIIDGPLRMPIVERYKEMGKIESGCCRIGDRCLIMPNRTRVEITNIYYEDIETDSCVCGENVRLKLKNVEEEEISSGFVLCDIEQEASAVEVQLKKLITLIDRKTGERTQEHRRFIKHNQVAIARFELTQSDETISMEPFKRFPQLSHFMLRDEVMVEPLLL